VTTGVKALLGVSMACEASFAPELARRAESAGFDQVWTTEFYSRSATVPLGAMAAVTQRIGLGTAIAFAFARRPVMLAAEARDIDELSGGRLTLGLGSAEPDRIRRWFGLDAAHPAARMEELAGLLRDLWAVDERAVHHDGRFYATHVEPVGPVPAPVRPQIPVYLAALGPRMVAAAGAMADGLLCHPFVTRAYLDDVVQPMLQEGLKRRALASPPRLASIVITTVHERSAVARREAAVQIAFYGTFPTFDVIFRHHGFQAAAAQLRAAHAANDWPGMVSAITDEMIDELAIAGTPAEVREKAAARAELYDHLIFHTPSTMYYRPVGAGIDEGRYHDNVTAILETFAR
jgi:probable F420-dependent oxidoreductase